MHSSVQGYPSPVRVLRGENILDPATKRLRDEECKRQRRIEPPAFDGDDRLPRDAERPRQIGLRPFEIKSTFGEVILHLSAR